jgi:hypothetical protein
VHLKLVLEISSHAIRFKLEPQHMNISGLEDPFNFCSLRLFVQRMETIHK